MLGHDRNILTAHMEDALEQGICALCHVTLGAEHSFLDMFLYERVNDLGAREQLRVGRGFCQYHTYRLIEVGGYGAHAKIAIIYKDLIDSMLKEVQALDESRGVPVEMAIDCPVCRTVAQSERRFIELLSSFLQRSDWQDRYRRSPGLCMPHFYRVLSASKAATRAFLKAEQLRRLEGLSWDVGEFIRKSVAKDEPFGAERDSWIRVVRTYAGTLKR